MNTIVSKDNKPPMHFFGGSVFNWERSADPFSWDGIPLVAKKKPVHGWMAEDWCGNPIGFLPDGYDWSQRKVSQALEVF